ncbi:MAG: hypothetical protein Q7T36_11540 [Fluviicoccus sp.]|nr:hypothetical protein [Fluviicoccus sp.]MDO8331091.1 hypothetical protein [Fluviicoccus sp.]
MPAFNRLTRLLKNFSADTRFFLMTLAAGDSPEAWQGSALEFPPKT